MKNILIALVFLSLSLTAQDSMIIATSPKVIKLRLPKLKPDYLEALHYEDIANRATYTDAKDKKTALESIKMATNIRPNNRDIQETALNVYIEYKEWNSVAITLKKMITLGYSKVQVDNIIKWNNITDTSILNIGKAFKKYNDQFWIERGNRTFQDFFFFLLGSDQTFRNITSKITDQTGKRLIPTEAIDSINCDTLLKFIKTIGYPSYYNMESESVIFLIERHLIRDCGNKSLELLNILVNEVEKENVPIFWFLDSIDQMFAWTNRGQKVIGTNVSNEEPILIYNKDYKTMDKTRAAFGLPPLYQVLKGRNIPIPVDYKIPE